MVILHDSLTCAINGNMLVVVTPLSLTDDWTSSLLVVAVIAKNRSDTHIRYTNADHLHWRCQTHGSANGRLVHNQWYWWPHAGLQTHIYRCTQNTLLLLASTYQCFYANNTTMYTMSKSSLKWSWQYLQCRDFHQNFLLAQVQRAAKSNQVLAFSESNEIPDLAAASTWHHWTAEIFTVKMISSSRLKPHRTKWSWCKLLSLSVRRDEGWLLEPVVSWICLLLLWFLTSKYYNHIMYLCFG